MTTETLVLDVTIPLKLRSLNELKGRHWSVRGREVKLAGHALIGRVKVATPPDGKRRLLVTRLMGPGEKPFDLDNLAGGSLKGLVDQLTELGYWRDDSSKWLSREYQQVRHTESATRVQVWEAE